MGAGASSHRFSPAEVAASVRELGAAYQQYGNAVEDNAVSGRVVARSLADGAVPKVEVYAPGGAPSPAPPACRAPWAR